ncbi:3-hydroxy-9,10-secoandrosta-1,3,5(10)-triene-9,17-dione monooxygenase reductase component [Pseudomonas sp. ok272]|uniref:flavin reductase family protein n=1 Tax=unclassified Pseudomonas TaxID=196821 RepID=UPI0008D040A0|nr:MULTISPECIES: flavin reductase family protein [unclassified Pseudomonas]SEN42647.1 3-hydroxy-9,10-secoandrosta-1,3,5(10)-triene-9,17-dione monooxygenase reductase component [Pseudomonas sp. ok272]SFN25744.1 3-hydroxy-9,10-secoandrosta-1,3,5(10)-triene-9,17-dione monooxygenase reductase component [Pseudomonas sp. ok602]
MHNENDRLHATPQTSSDVTLDAKAFRHALGTFTTGVTIVTARGQDGAPVGVTANSFNSVSMDPPLVLWSLARKSQSLAAFEQASHWAVHILAHDQGDLSGRFARSVSGPEKFEGIHCEEGLGSTPLLVGCTTRLQCRTAHIYDGGDHIILVGEVLTFDKCDAPPLVFQRGNYAIATSTAQTIMPSPGEDPRNVSEMSPLGYLLASAYLHFSTKSQEQASLLELNDVEYLIVSALGAREGRTYHELITLAAYTGRQVGPESINDLAARGLIRIDDDGEDEHYMSQNQDHAQIYLTQEGHALVSRIVSESQRVEENMMRQLGIPETIALRTLLSRFVRIHSPLIPYRWF